MPTSPNRANPRLAGTSAEDLQEYTPMIIQPTGTRQPPPLGDLSVRALTGILVAVWCGNSLPSDLIDRDATVNDVRVELRRREGLDVGLRP
jgi:hypothetical protein